MALNKNWKLEMCRWYRLQDFNPRTGFPFKRNWRPINPRTGYPFGYVKTPEPWKFAPDQRTLRLCPGEAPPPPSIVLTWGGEALTWGGTELTW